MAAPLPPRIKGPLTELMRKVTVVGVDPAADVTVYANGKRVGKGPVASGGLAGLDSSGSTHAVIELDVLLKAGQQVTAKQTVGVLSSKPSTKPITVIGPPSHLGKPKVITFPVAGVEALLVRGIYPGSEVIVSIPNRGIQEITEADDFEVVAPTPDPLQAGDELWVIQQLGGTAAGWKAPAPIARWTGEDGRDGNLPTPVFELVPEPCDRGVKLGNIVPGATVVVEVNGHESRRRSVVGRVVVPTRGFLIPAPGGGGLEKGDQLVIWQEFPATGQRTNPAGRLVHTVGPPKTPTQPTLWRGICPSATEIVVTGYRPGALIRVYERKPGQGSFARRDELTHRAGLSEPDVIPIATGFTNGSEVAATQAPCGTPESPRSIPVPVETVYEDIDGKPRILEPVQECADGLTADNLIFTASVSIWSDQLGGQAGPSRTVIEPPPLWFDVLIQPGDELRVVQIGCLPQRLREGDRVPVQGAAEAGVVLDYVFAGDRIVWAWCSAKDAAGEDVGVNGAEVNLFAGSGSGRRWIGRGWSRMDGWAQIGVAGRSLTEEELLTVTAQLCGEPGSSESRVLRRRPPTMPVLLEPKPTTTLTRPTFTWKDPDAGGPYEALSYSFGLIEPATGRTLVNAPHVLQPSMDWSRVPELEVGPSYTWYVESVGRRGRSSRAVQPVKVIPAPAPEPKAGSAQPAAFSRLLVCNCNEQWETHPRGGTVTTHMLDLTAGGKYQELGTIPVGYPEGGGSCGLGTTAAAEYKLTDGHTHVFVFVDPDQPGCDDADPENVECARLALPPLLGKDGAPPFLVEIV